MRPLLLLAFATSLVSSAATLALHEGANNPTTEGWAPSSCCGAVGPFDALPSDLGLGAWAMPVSGDGQAFYTESLTSAERDSALATGWRMTLIARVVSLGAAPIDDDFGAWLYFSTGSRRYDMSFEAGSVGVIDRVFAIRNFDRTEFATDTSAYHRIELIAAPGSTTADFYLDGVLLLTGFTGHTDFVISPGVRISALWGPGQGNIHLAKFEVGSFTTAGPYPPLTGVPEPSTMALTGFGLAAALRLRRR